MTTIDLELLRDSIGPVWHQDNCGLNYDRECGACSCGAERNQRLRNAFNRVADRVDLADRLVAFLTEVEASKMHSYMPGVPHDCPLCRALDLAVPKESVVS